MKAMLTSKQVGGTHRKVTKIVVNCANFGLNAVQC